MGDELAKKVQERFQELPKTVQEAIQSAGFDEKVREVAERHALHIDQTGVLGDETTMVMLGFTNPEDFADVLVEQLHLTKQQAEDIARDINASLFLPIRSLMKKPTAGVITNPPYTPPTPPAPPTAPAPAAPKPVPPPVPAPTPVPPAFKPVVPAPTPVPPTTPKPALPVEMHEALSKPVVSTPPPAPKVEAPKEEPPKPAAYKADPYREIPE